MSKSSTKVSIDDMADEIMKGLEEYSDLAAEDMKEAVEETAKSVQQDIKSSAPVRTRKYKNSWRTKVTEESSTSLTVTVYSSNRYQLAHLLEKGHAKRGGGRVAARPHIAPAEETGKEKLTRLIERALEG